MTSLRHSLAEYIRNLPQKSKIEIFCIGSMIGLIASWIYILAGGDTWLFVPVWAEIIFYPGFHIGLICYDIFGGNVYLALIFGSIVVGLFYGIIFVVVLSVWSLLARMGKYVIATLCIIAILIGIAFLIHLTMIDKYGGTSLRQKFSLSITSDPPGAKVYELRNYNNPPESIGTTPLELKGSYSIDRDGSGWSVGGRGIRLEATEWAYLIRLDCFVIEEGYNISEVSPVLATIPMKNVKPNHMPSKLEYNAKLVPIEPNKIKKIGTAIMVNGSLVYVKPNSLKVQEGVYLIDIKEAK